MSSGKSSQTSKLQSNTYIDKYFLRWGVPIRVSRSLNSEPRKRPDNIRLIALIFVIGTWLRFLALNLSSDEDVNSILGNPFSYYPKANGLMCITVLIFVTVLLSFLFTMICFENSEKMFGSKYSCQLLYIIQIEV